MSLKNVTEFLRRIDSDPGAFRNDAELSAYANSQLIHVSQKLYETQFAQPKYAQILPVNTEIPAGAASYQVDNVTDVGEALITDDYAADSPGVDEILESDLRKLVPIRAHYNYTVQHLREAAMTGRSLPLRRALIARRVIERSLNKLFAQGNADYDILGFFNQDVDTDDVAGGAWSSKDPDERVADIQEMVSFLKTNSLDIEGGSGLALVLPSNKFDLLRAAMPSTAVSALSFLQQSIPELSAIHTWNYATNAGDGGAKDRMVLFTPSAEKIEALLPVSLYDHPAEQRGLSWNVELEARAGGVALYVPGSMVYRDGF